MKDQDHSLNVQSTESLVQAASSDSKPDAALSVAEQHL